MDDIRELCKRVIIINFGKIIYDGLLSELINKYAKEKIIRISTIKEVPRSEFEKHGFIDDYQETVAVIRVPREDVKKVMKGIVDSDIPIDDILIDEILLMTL